MSRDAHTDTHRPYPLGEEIANAVTHGLGVGLGIAGLVILVVQAASLGDPWRVTAFSIYGATMIALYLASTLYHSIPSPAAKRVLQRLDHAAIYLFIAGSYTPLLLVTLRSPMGWTFFGIVWGVALLGCALEFLAGRRWRKLSLGVYLALGWVAVLIFKQIWLNLPAGGIALLVSGGAAYTAGVIFYVWKRLPYSHAIWHLFVLGGSACHFLLFLVHVLPLR
jgi:hemolysin III